MNTAEKKLKLFRHIDSLTEKELDKIYQQLIQSMDEDQLPEGNLTPEIMSALNEAIRNSSKGNVFSEDEVKELTRKKFPSLFK